MRKREFIKGKGIYLRNLINEDINKNYIHWFDDDEVCRQNSHHKFPFYEEELRSYIDSLRNNKTMLVLAIIEKLEDIHIGNISLQNIDFINRSAEFAIIIGEKSFWGKGYGKEAVSMIVRHGFETLNLNRIYCGTFFENVGLIKLVEFLGFKQEGIRRKAMYKNGNYVDIIEFGLLKSEWKNDEVDKW